MDNQCFDIFMNYDLPFETYFNDCINHDDLRHEDLEIIWVIKGSATIINGDKTYLMTSQTVFLIHTNTRHAIYSEPGSVIISYRLKKAYLKEKGLHFEKIPYKEQVHSFEALAMKYHQVPLLIVQIVKLLLKAEHKDVTRYKLIGYYNMFIHELYNMMLKEKYLDVKTKDYDEYLNRIHLIVDYTYQHFKEKITLEDIARITKLSKYRVSHFVKEALGIPYKVFLQNARFEHALKLLKETKLSIKDIIKSSGFSDHKYLTSLMKKRYQITPLKYRKLMIENKILHTFDASIYDFLQELKQCIRRIESDRAFQKIFGIRI
jgi:AraC-like DNA-binding protein